MRRQALVLVTFAVGCTAATATEPLATPSGSAGGTPNSDSGSAGNGPPAFVMVRPKVDTLAIGQSLQLADTVEDSYGHVLKGVTLLWASHDTAVAAVTQSGAIRAQRAGVDTVTASSGAVVGAAVVVVRDTAHAPPSARDTLTLFGFVKSDSGHCDPADGCAFSFTSPIDVTQLFWFDAHTADQTSAFTVPVGAIDSVTWYAWTPGDVPPPNGPGMRGPDFDCHTWSGTTLECPASDSGTHAGSYVVYVEPAPVPGYVIGAVDNNSFILTTFPASAGVTAARVAAASTRPRSAGRVSSPAWSARRR